MLTEERHQAILQLLKQQDGWFICRVTVDNVWRSGDPTVLAGV